AIQEHVVVKVAEAEVGLLVGHAEEPLTIIDLTFVGGKTRSNLIDPECKASLGELRNSGGPSQGACAGVAHLYRAVDHSALLSKLDGIKGAFKTHAIHLLHVDIMVHVEAIPAGWRKFLKKLGQLLHSVLIQLSFLHFTSPVEKVAGAGGQEVGDSQTAGPSSPP